MTYGPQHHSPGDVPSRVPPPGRRAGERLDVWHPRALRLIPGELATADVGTVDDLLEALVEAGHLTREDIRSIDGRIQRRLYLASRPGPAPGEDPYPGPVVLTHWGSPDDPEEAAGHDL